MKKIFKYLFLFVGAGAAVAFATGLILLFSAYRSLPDIEELVKSYKDSEPTIIYDSKGKQVDLITKRRGEPIHIDEIPENMKNAVIAIEDKRFYTHHGFDMRRLGKAVLVNLSRGRAVQGGSTITQQLAKNAFLSNEKTFLRKVKEALITLEIEKRYEKDEILEKYLNEIYFGSGSYGIKEASRSIFDKDVSKINLAEVAILAGVPNRPSKYDPRKNLDKAIERGQLVLKLMLKQEFITELEYERAMNHKFVYEKDLKNSGKSKYVSAILDKRSKRYFKSPEFTDIVEDELVEMFDEKTVYEGGLKVYTGLDADMQKIALETFNNYKPFTNNSKLQGALVTIDTETGYVKSIVGGKNFRSGNFNRAISAKRQPGSAFKPFVYYTALEKGIAMNELRDDSAEKYGDWQPKNYGNKSYGEITILQAIENSVNTIAVKLLKEVGISSVISNFKKTGVSIDIPKDLSIALGTMSITPMELATSYAPFSNGGYSVQPIFITKIEDRDGNVLYEQSVVKKQVLDSENISLITHMLKDVVSYGSGRRARVRTANGKYAEQGGKTGTTNDNKSAWFAGVTPEYATTVYIGYDDNTSMPSYASGGSIAAPLWGEYYQAMINRGVYTPGDFGFINENLKNKTLVSRTIDLRTGELGSPSREYKRTALFKKGQVPDGFTDNLYWGIKNMFGNKDDQVEDEENEDGEKSKKKKSRLFFRHFF
ncbi:transglycosylase domain-containing protein [Ilyobacter polytropus]|uniref:Penicillin-binding protein, 1A family n=1 Tax=Ilyobacter polytropus (strain ATCC 51220 / DSM 2926 / LMG 16218 / CuHBu1) TaxID=572544 RepID=E3H6Z7_ILYPC|nr:PBP1A family penicillin-binding protein [Ilyobacter polytropus]ADO82516.1 penicillin-binding protein, 1A family [Ilyobacter polytropus DSM 2926]